MKGNIKLYHHKTDGGAEYLTDKYIKCSNGHKEGIFEGANFIVRIDGDITKDAELTISSQSEYWKVKEALRKAKSILRRQDKIIEIYNTYLDQIELTEEDKKELDKLSQI